MAGYPAEGSYTSPFMDKLSSPAFRSLSCRQKIVDLLNMLKTVSKSEQIEDAVQICKMSLDRLESKELDLLLNTLTTVLLYVDRHPPNLKLLNFQEPDSRPSFTEFPFNELQSLDRTCFRFSNLKELKVLSCNVLQTIDLSHLTCSLPSMISHEIVPHRFNKLESLVSLETLPCSLFHLPHLDLRSQSISDFVADGNLSRISLGDLKFLANRGRFDDSNFTVTYAIMPGIKWTSSASDIKIVALSQHFEVHRTSITGSGTDVLKSNYDFQHKLDERSNFERITEDEVTLHSSKQRDEISIQPDGLPQKSSKFLAGESSFKLEDVTEIADSEFQTAVQGEGCDVEDSSEDESVSLRVTNTIQLNQLPPKLSSLKIEGCDGLKSLSEDLMHKNRSLRHLYIIDCHSFTSFYGDLRSAPLKTLYIRNCRKLDFLSSTKRIHGLKFLEDLCLGSSCDSLVSFPLDSFPKLRSLSVWDCSNFSSISIKSCHMSLVALEIMGCHSLEFFPKGGLPTYKLTSILISSCHNLKALPDRFFCLKSLQSLTLIKCPLLNSIPYGGFPSSLSSLCITSCFQLTSLIEWELFKLRNLTFLEVEDVCNDLESFPEQDLLPESLNSLRISKLSSLESLNDKGFQYLTSLRTLEIDSCEKLHSLPEEGLPKSLIDLYVNGCTLLKSKILQKKGKDCYNISRIPHIRIDGVKISKFTRQSNFMY